MADASAIPCTLEVAALTDVGTERGHNEDACGHFIEGDECVVVAVADGVSQAAAGEVASQMAIDVTLRAYRDEPPKRSPGERLYRAVQQANIELHDKAMAVPELRGMSTTLVAAVVHRGELTSVHAGDSRLYLIRGGAITQLTKDHTVAAEKVRLRVMSRDRARTHPDRSVLTRSLGRELIVSRDRIVQPLQQDDRILLCSDGLHNVLEDAELADIIGDRSAADACQALIEAANARGTPDNLTAALIRVVGAPPLRAPATGAWAGLKRFLGG